MPERKCGGRWILVCVTAMLGAVAADVAAHAAPKAAVSKHAALTHVAAALAKHPVAKHVAGKQAGKANAISLPRPRPLDRVVPKRAVTRHAAPQRAPAKDVSSVVTLARLAGSWRSVKSEVEVRIEQGPMGWEAWFSASGEARITLSERQTIKVQGRNFACTYTVTLPTIQTMKWQLTNAHPAAQCLEESFIRLGPAPEAARSVVPMNPAPQSKALTN